VRVAAEVSAAYPGWDIFIGLYADEGVILIVPGSHELLKPSNFLARLHDLNGTGSEIAAESSI
jgi:hypothetical protein